MKTLIAASLLLTGCVSLAPEAWTHSPDEHTLVKRAIYECNQEGNREITNGVLFGGAIMPIVALFARKNVVNACMESRGYKSQ